MLQDVSYAYQLGLAAYYRVPPLGRGAEQTGGADFRLWGERWRSEPAGASWRCKVSPAFTDVACKNARKYETGCYCCMSCSAGSLRQD